MEETDVVIIGGAFSGAAAGILLRRRNPALRVHIIERTTEFDRKVGESTTEVSSCFLTRVLGIANYLGHHQLPKQGLRMWFHSDADDPFERCGEIGALYNSRLPGFQVDRATLDEHLLATAVAAGCELSRPARVTAIRLREQTGEKENEVTFSTAPGESRTLRAKWIMDASGRAAVLARQLGNFEPMGEHPTNSLWARFTGVRDWDGPELRAKFRAWSGATRAARGWATNHLCGLGWWVWMIPLKSRGANGTTGDVSIGLVYDTRLFDAPTGGGIGERILAHCRKHPVGRELLADAQPIEGDQRAYSQLPYRVLRVAGDGWVCIGDAAGFLDPLYSPGLDFCSYTAAAAAALIASEQPDFQNYNTRFRFCFESWFEGLYRDKYYHLGDAQLMAAAFLTEIAAYHLGPVRDVYADPAAKFAEFPFGGRAGRVAAQLLAFFNRRLSHLARKKIAHGRYGDRNLDMRLLVGGFTPEPGVSGRLLLRGIREWLKLEIASAFWPRASARS